MKCSLLLLLIISTCNCFLLNNVQSLPHERIIGGKTDWQHRFKYQVSIQVKKRQTGLYQHACGGSIISEKHILTAAHCFLRNKTTILDISNEHVRVVAGTSQLDSDGVYRFIDKVFIYGRYNYADRYKYGDIAVVKLENTLDVKNDPRLAVIKLPQKSSYDSYVNKVASVSGFGIFRFECSQGADGNWTKTPILPNDRQYLQVRIVSKDRCTPYDSIICTLFDATDDNIHGICEGDSGGPLVYKKTVIGVVSRAAKDCDMRNKTAKFTLVSSFLDFIKDAMIDSGDKSGMIVLDKA